MSECLRMQLRESRMAEDSQIFGQVLFEDLGKDSIILGCEEGGCTAELEVATDQAYSAPNSGLFDPELADLSLLVLKCKKTETGEL